MSNYARGRRGEHIAIRYLSTKQYEILDKNVRTPFGEIDIVAKKNNVLIFIEVKSRSSTRYGSPAESISRQKLRHLEQSLLSIQQKMTWQGKIQLDVVCILNGKVVHHIQNTPFS